MDVVTLGAALSIMKKMPDTAASSAAAAEDAADRAEEAARTLTVDDTLTKPGQPADSKAVGDALAEKLDIADLPDTVDNANQLLSEKYVVDTEPYHLRPSGGQGANREFDTIVGGSVVWNQLVGESATSVTVTSGHKYIAKISGSYSVAASDGTAITVTGGTDEVFDITQMFGSEIADYIYSLEQATAGAGVAWFRKYFPNEYYEYNPGELMHVTDLQSHDMVGFNLWDEEWEAGSFDQTTGEKIVSNSVKRSKNPIKVLPNTKYCRRKNSSSLALRIFFYDGEMKLLSSDVQTIGVRVFTTPSDCHYINIVYQSNETGICINLSWSGTRDGEYEPYVKHSYPLDPSLTLRGIPKLVDGKLAYDGDVYKPDGTVERRYGIVDLGTLKYVNNGTNSVVVKLPQKKSGSNLLICNKLLLVSSSLDIGAMPDNSFRCYTTSSNIAVKINNINTNNAADLLTGITLVYELAEPTTEQADPFQSLQILDPYGIEEYVTTSIVPVGHETKYPENLRAKIEGLPWNFASLIAPVEAEFKATRNYTSGSLFIVNNVLYKATANIANGGTITPNTNCSATTLAEVIAAL